MKRMLLALLMGISVVFGLTAAAIIQLQNAELGAQLYAFDDYLPALFLFWPASFLQHIFPSEPGSQLKLSGIGLIAMLICDVILYSLLGYLFLWTVSRWRARRNALP